MIPEIRQVTHQAHALQSSHSLNKSYFIWRRTSLGRETWELSSHFFKSLSYALRFWLFLCSLKHRISVKKKLQAVSFSSIKGKNLIESIKELGRTEQISPKIFQVNLGFSFPGRVQSIGNHFKVSTEGIFGHFSPQGGSASIHREWRAAHPKANAWPLNPGEGAWSPSTRQPRGCLESAVPLYVLFVSIKTLDFKLCLHGMQRFTFYLKISSRTKVPGLQRYLLHPSLF